MLLAVLPPLLWIGWTKYEAWRAEQERQRAIQQERQRAIQALQEAGWQISVSPGFRHALTADARDEPRKDYRIPFEP
jgi:hypothetical protein